MTERICDFLDEGIVGFAVLALALIVLPMLPLIALGYGFSRLAQGMSAEGENSRSEVEGEARQPGPQGAPETNPQNPR